MRGRQHLVTAGAENRVVLSQVPLDPSSFGTNSTIQDDTADGRHFALLGPFPRSHPHYMRAEASCTQGV